MLPLCAGLLLRAGYRDMHILKGPWHVCAAAWMALFVRTFSIPTICGCGRAYAPLCGVRALASYRCNRILSRAAVFWPTCFSPFFNLRR